MKFKGTIGTQFSGSLAGVTASRNAGGAYLRQRAVPVQPNTTAQQLLKAYFAALSTAWTATLTAAQRTAWDTYALNTPITNALGESIHITGRDFYLGNNTLRLRGSLTPVADGPTTFGLPGLTAPTGTVTAASGLSLAFTNTDAWAGAVGGALLVQASVQMAPTIFYHKGPFRYVGKVAGAATPPTSPSTFAAALFPSALTAGNVVFLRYRATTADGRLSAPIIERCVIA